MFKTFNISFYYMPFAKSHILLWESLDQSLCNIYANMHELWILFSILWLIEMVKEYFHYSFMSSYSFKIPI